MTLEGFAARVFQHEVDHMHGKLFFDYIKSADDVLKLSDDGKLIPVDEIPPELVKAAQD